MSVCYRFPAHYGRGKPPEGTYVEGKRSWLRHCSCLSSTNMHGVIWLHMGPFIPATSRRWDRHCIILQCAGTNTIAMAKKHEGWVYLLSLENWDQINHEWHFITKVLPGLHFDLINWDTNILSLCLIVSLLLSVQSSQTILAPDYIICSVI